MSEWSFNPICDGYKEYQEIIRHYYIDKETEEEIYFTGSNYRAYHKYSICETKEEAKEISDIKNNYGFDSCKYDARLRRDISDKIDSKIYLNNIGMV